mmetsp:Transcript_25819/g.78501  ORF Transcript_25819/g.78501 Transcript_25819/m.78501 type:complete len:204 (+) Transcript_25819:355-966(+)|eukprot:scaffold55663_cov35-Tisochrysis_lutea.AAC.2
MRSARWLRLCASTPVPCMPNGVYAPRWDSIDGDEESTACLVGEGRSKEGRASAEGGAQNGAGEECEKQSAAACSPRAHPRVRRRRRKDDRRLTARCAERQATPASNTGSSSGAAAEFTQVAPEHINTQGDCHRGFIPRRPARWRMSARAVCAAGGAAGGATYWLVRVGSPLVSSRPAPSCSLGCTSEQVLTRPAHAAPVRGGC